MKLLNFIICDDIRNEIGNKLSLMGIYDSSIEFSVTPDQKDRWPKSLRIGIFVKIKLEKNEEVNKFQMRKKSNDKEVELGGGPLNIPHDKKEKTINIVMINPNFIFEKPGNITFSIDFYDNSGGVIKSLSPDMTIEVKEKITN